MLYFVKASDKGPDWIESHPPDLMYMYTYNVWMYVVCMCMCVYFIGSRSKDVSLVLFSISLQTIFLFIRKLLRLPIYTLRQENKNVCK